MAEGISAGDIIYKVTCRSVEIKIAPPKANVKKPATQEVMVDVFCVNQGALDITYAFLEYDAT